MSSDELFDITTQPIGYPAGDDFFTYTWETTAYTNTPFSYQHSSSDALMPFSFNQNELKAEVEKLQKEVEELKVQIKNILQGVNKMSSIREEEHRQIL